MSRALSQVGNANYRANFESCVFRPEVHELSDAQRERVYDDVLDDDGHDLLNELADLKSLDSFRGIVQALDFVRKYQAKLAEAEAKELAKT